MSTANVQWISPTIMSKTTSANMIKMTVDFKDGTPLGDITITKLKSGIYAEDKGNYCRRFSDAEALRWEFEYPQSLVAEIEDLPMGDTQPPEIYLNHDALNSYMEMNTGLQDLINLMKNEIPRGTNMTPKKKKRKKRK